MEHQDAVELLPWLVNDTLTAAENREIREQLRGSEELRRELRETLDVARALGRPPSPDAMIDHALGRSIPEGRWVENYVAASPEAADEMKRLRQSLLLLEHPELEIVRPAAERRPPSFHWRAAAVAAALVAIVGVGGWIDNSGDASRLRQRVADLEATARASVAATDVGPRLNLSVIDLVPTSFIERSAGGDVYQVPLAELGELVSLILVSDSDATYDSYSIEISDPAGTVVWRGVGLERTAQHEYTLLVPRELLGIGVYTLEVHGAAETGEVPVEKYTLELVP